MLEGAIRSILLADSTITELVSGGIHPLTNSQKSSRPFIAYEIVTEEDPSPTSTGPSGFTRTSFDIVTVADTYADCAQIGVEVRRVFEGYRGTTNEVRLCWLRFDDESDIEQAVKPGEDRPLYVRQQTFRTLYTSVN